MQYELWLHSPSLLRERRVGDERGDWGSGPPTIADFLCRSLVRLFFGRLFNAVLP